MANKHLARYLTSLIIGEMQIEITVRNPFLSIRIAKIKKADNTKRLSKFEFTYFAGGRCKFVYHLGKLCISSL